MFSLVCTKAHAVEVLTGKVKILEATYMPVKILSSLMWELVLVLRVHG